MKRWLREFFYVPKHGKLPEKVLLTRIGLSIGIMVTCLIALSLSAVAYFSCDITSMVQPLKSATFQLDVSTTTAEALPNGSYLMDNSGETTANDFLFTLTLPPPPQSNATTGFCTIWVQTEESGPHQELYTEPFGTFDGAQQPVTEQIVSITVPAGKQAWISFHPQWGSLSDSYSAIPQVGGVVDLNGYVPFSEVIPSGPIPGTENDPVSPPEDEPEIDSELAPDDGLADDLPLGPEEEPNLSTDSSTEQTQSIEQSDVTDAGSTDVTDTGNNSDTGSDSSSQTTDTQDVTDVSDSSDNTTELSDEA